MNTQPAKQYSANARREFLFRPGRLCGFLIGNVLHWHRANSREYGSTVGASGIYADVLRCAAGTCLILGGHSRGLLNSTIDLRELVSGKDVFIVKVFEFYG